MKHGPLKVPSPLQPPRLDLIERGVSLRGLRCGGDAWRNGSRVENGQMFCCALDQNAQVRCWGATPPHANVFNVTGFDNASVFDIRRRRCVGRSRYMREFALRLILDTHPNASLAEAATNHTRPFVCHNVPRRWTQNITTHLIDWIGANFSNITHTYKVRSWQLSMLLTLQLAAYTDGFSCFNFSAPIPELHCGAMVPYVNRSVAIAAAPPKPFTIRRVRSSDTYTTEYTLAHTQQRDRYCIEKLRVAPAEQFQRGAGWHRDAQRIADGFETTFAIQMPNAARLCKRVKTLTTQTIMYEQCAHTAADGIALVLRGGEAPAALGRGGGQLGYGGLRNALAIEFDTWSNEDMEDVPFNHVAIQAGGPEGAVGAHSEQTLATAILPLETHPNGLADGAAHLVRVVYTPRFEVDAMKHAAPQVPNTMMYWVEEGVITDVNGNQALGTWARRTTGTLKVYVDQMKRPIIAIPIDLGYALGAEDGRAWVGFTAATGTRFQDHFVLSWQFCEGEGGCDQATGTPQRMTYCEAFGCNPKHPSPRYATDELEAEREQAVERREAEEAEREFKAEVERRAYDEMSEEELEEVRIREDERAKDDERRERAAEVRLGEAMRAEIELCGAPMCAAPLDPFLIELSQGVPKQRRVPIGDGVQPSREERATPHYDDEHEAGEWMAEGAGVGEPWGYEPDEWYVQEEPLEETQQRVSGGYQFL